jgi:mono/diheme cytochrome c family protein
MEDHARRIGGVCAALAVAALAACSSARPVRRSEPLAGPFVVTEPAQGRGRLVFMAQCYQCHPGGEAGLGPSLNDKNITQRRARHHLRRSPPLVDVSHLGDRELSDLTAYLAALRRHSERVQEPFEAQEASR